MYHSITVMIAQLLLDKAEFGLQDGLPTQEVKAGKVRADGKGQADQGNHDHQQFRLTQVQPTPKKAPVFTKGKSPVL